MNVILFIYGLSFFTFGIVALIVKTKQSNIFFANKIWLLGIFGVSHAFFEWVFMYRLSNPQFETPLLAIQSCLLIISYLSLFEFSRFIIKESFSKKEHHFHLLYKLYDSKIIYPITLANLFVFIMIDPSFDGIISAIRCTYGFFGSLFLGLGLYFYSESLKKITYAQKLKYYFKIPGIAFIFYGFTAVIAANPTVYFPANTFNAVWFYETFGFHVQFFRLICSMVIAICFIKALQIFNEEADLKLNNSLNQIKRFSSDVSHELKTPITSMKIEVEYVLKKERPLEQYKKTLESLLEEINQLESIVKNLLTLAYTQKSSIMKKFTTTEADSIVLRCIDDLWSSARNKGVNFEIKRMDSCLILCEPSLLQLAFSNLLENSIKYSNSKKAIEIDLHVEGSRLYFCVKDYGDGVAKEKLPYIFDRFYRCDESRSKNILGFGLGLSIVKQIVDLHNAQIKIENHPEGGVVATISLPVIHSA